jgi:competence ComEA-like helix-hairpin-helix protein
MGVLKDYFSFSKRERTGAIVLIILIVTIFILPEFFPAPGSSLDAGAIAEFKRQTSELRAAKSDSSGIIEISATSNYEKSSGGDRQKPVLFYFDPNTVSTEGWQKLGISNRTIETIKKYISKGGSFRKPEDLAKIYGIPKNQYQQLRPFVKIPQRNDHKQEKAEYAGRLNDYKTNKRPVSTVDINEADTSTLIALPGIGSKLANRIIGFRDKLGGFYSVEQMREVYGIPDSTFQKIQPYLKCEGLQVERININTAELETLRSHPYIKWNVANAIVNYRQQHGSYTNPNDLIRIEIITAELLQKLAPYLTTE